MRVRGDFPITQNAENAAILDRLQIRPATTRQPKGRRVYRIPLIRYAASTGSARPSCGRERRRYRRRFATRHGRPGIYGLGRCRLETLPPPYFGGDPVTRLSCGAWHPPHYLLPPHTIFRPSPTGRVILRPRMQVDSLVARTTDAGRFKGRYTGRAHWR